MESWCAADDVIEQFRVCADRPFGVAVEYHPERSGSFYTPLFAGFFGQD